MTNVILKSLNTWIIKLLFITFTLFHFSNAIASNNLYIVDIYGTTKISNEKIKAEFDSELTTIARASKDNSFRTSTNGLDATIKALSSIIGKLMLTENFAYIHVSPVNYYKYQPVIYITIDVVEKGDMRRLVYFSPEPKLSITDPNHLISTWLEYEKTANNITNKQNAPTTFKSCPAHHCTYGFEHPSLLKYKNSFSTAENYKSDLVKILRNDKDAIKRGAAAFVLAHIKSDQELVRLLLPSVNDSSSHVRNNVMRVLALALEKNNNLKVPLNKIIDALNFPETTDRNKALYVLSSLANNPKNSVYIKKQAGSHLISTLKLEQPNNHDPSYDILKKISGKNYVDRDYKSWENWLRQK